MEKGDQLPNGLFFLDIIWFSYSKGSFGLLKAKRDSGQVKFYLCPVPGVNEYADICYIACHGAKVCYKDIFTFLSKVE